MEIRFHSGVEGLAKSVVRGYRYSMEKVYLYAPYKGNTPACVSINGHKLLILSTDAGELEENMHLVGATRLKKIKAGESVEEHSARLTKLAKVAKSGIVVAPTEVGFDELLKNLEEQLPWVQ